MVGVYKIINPKGKIYVGQSKDVNGRWGDYKRLKCKGQVKLYNSFKKHGVDNHKFEVLSECSELDLNNLERYYQELYECIGKNGLNCYLVASNCEKSVVSKETREKISKTLTGRKIPREIVEKIRLKAIGRKMPIEAIIRGVEKRKGIKRSDVTREKLRKHGLNHGSNMSTALLICNMENGVFHTSMKQAYECYGIASTTAHRKIHNKSNYFLKIV